MSNSDFRKFVPAVGTSRYFGRSQRDELLAVREDRRIIRKKNLERLANIPFKGVSTDGSVRRDLFELRSEGAPTSAILKAVARLAELLTQEQQAALYLPLKSDGRRQWQNSIAHYEEFGLWLESLSVTVQRAAMEVVRASLSDRGYERVRDIMKLNGFLGELVGAPRLLGEWSYNFHVYGTPSPSEPWGWQLAGHHLAVTCFIVGDQMTLTPAFMGAEPRYADAGPYSGLRTFEAEERGGLKFVRSLSAPQRRKAIVYDTILPTSLPPGRHSRADGMTLGGAWQDDAVVPYEGIAGAGLERTQRRALLDLVERYLSTLPSGPFACRMDDVERHFGETHFCWAGGVEDDSVFYYRIQSPIVMIEFDHHKGVVLDNALPEKFHVHTVVRTPNGNDFGMDLLRLHYEMAPHHTTLHAHDDDDESHSHGKASKHEH